MTFGSIGLVFVGFGSGGLGFDIGKFIRGFCVWVFCEKVGWVGCWAMVLGPKF